ncbi:MAG: D-glycero-alpha-D-manno-heptose-1,7-bisphosphate 7-phosphatase, partial [Pyrinomonadaceae bacterium]
AGVARGYFSEEMVAVVHEQLRKELAKTGALLDGIYYCPHHPSVGEHPYRLDCECRKPKPGLINRASAELGVNPAVSWMIGDRYSDLVMARNAGLHSGLVLTGYGRGEWEYQRSSWKFEPDIVAEDLLEAVKRIVKL